MRSPACERRSKRTVTLPLIKRAGYAQLTYLDCVSPNSTPTPPTSSVSTATSTPGGQGWPTRQIGETVAGPAAAPESGSGTTPRAGERHSESGNGITFAERMPLAHRRKMTHSGRSMATQSSVGGCRKEMASAEAGSRSWRDRVGDPCQSSR